MPSALRPMLYARCSLLYALCSLLFSASFSPLFAQGSIYSQYGLGEIRSTGSARTFAMGDMGITSTDKSGLNFSSPATWDEIQRSTFSAGFIYEGVESQDASGKVFLGSGNFNGASFAFPVYKPKGIVLGFGLTPLTVVNYHTTFTGAQRGINYSLENFGTGGLSLLTAGISYKIHPQLHLGASFNYTFGSIERNQHFLSYALQTVSTNTNLQQHYSGSGIQLGLLYNLQEGVLGTKKTSFGVEFSPQISLTTNNDSTTEYYATDDIYVTPTSTAIAASKEFTTTYPTRITLGISSQINDQWFVGAEIRIHQWKNYTVDGVHPAEFENSARISVGGEYVGTRNDLSASYTSRMAYRYGFSYAKTPYTIAGTSVNELAFSGGLGFPAGTESRLNVSLQYALRGTTSGGLVKENIFRLNVSFDGTEMWFDRPVKQ